NLQITEDKKLIPGNGVYAVKVSIVNSQSSIVDTGHSSFGIQNSYLGMMNIGVRPTVEGVNRMIEVNIFDFDKDIYGEVLTIHIFKRLRNEQKFNGLEELKEQLGKDKEQAIVSLSSTA
ncbi:MAG TPA: riboflavin kinase, partial [Ferruginibacter sp.]|nr:riboflavin kinase [Ferruginibacter sp.]HPH93255.1 riboflavin kinase [Ferruginibacter sp.]